MRLTFNVLTFEHPNHQLTFYFTDIAHDHLTKIHHTLVSKAFTQLLGERGHYYTSFQRPDEDLVPITINVQKVKPYLLKRYYNQPARSRQKESRPSLPDMEFRYPNNTTITHTSTRKEQQIQKIPCPYRSILQKVLECGQFQEHHSAQGKLYQRQGDPHQCRKP